MRPLIHCSAASVPQSAELSRNPPVDRSHGPPRSLGIWRANDEAEGVGGVREPSGAAVRPDEAEHRTGLDAPAGALPARCQVAHRCPNDVVVEAIHLVAKETTTRE